MGGVPPREGEAQVYDSAEGEGDEGGLPCGVAAAAAVEGSAVQRFGLNSLLASPFLVCGHLDMVSIARLALTNNSWCTAIDSKLTRRWWEKHPQEASRRNSLLAVNQDAQAALHGLRFEKGRFAFLQHFYGCRIISRVAHISVYSLSGLAEPWSPTS